MTMNILCIDFETKDPLLLKYSSGSVLKYHYPEIDFEVIGCGVYDGAYKEYFDLKNDSDAINRLFLTINEYDGWLFHNAAYDLGCLKYLYRDTLDLCEVLILDTLLMAKLIDQQLAEKITFSFSPYSLDSLCKYYELKDVKESDILHDYVWATGIYQDWVKKHTKRACHTRPSKSILHTWSIVRLADFPVEIVSEYCLADVLATWGLYNRLKPILIDYDLTMMSDTIKLCLKIKFRGLRLDLDAAKDLSNIWKNIALDAKNKVLEYLAIPNLNIGSGKQLGPALMNKGHKVPLTNKGNYSITKTWLDEQKEDVFKELRRYRKANKSENDYVQKILSYQDIIPEKYRDPKVGIMFPTLKPLGATATGRFTSGGGTGSLELNVLAISKHDAEFGVPIRKLFLPDEPDEKIICCDFSNQEPRLQVHYAKLLKCSGVDNIVSQWIADPQMKYHNTVAEMTGLEYDVAKMVTLGLAYDMRAYGLSIKLGIDYGKAQQLIEQYYNLLPFMRQLQRITSNNLLKLGYIKTIGGRKLTIDLPYEFKGEIRTQERKGMSKLIQGSGADQLIKSMVDADKAGLKVLISVHDEILISSKHPDQDLVKLKDCMENSYKLIVPVIAEGGIGSNWYEAKP